MGSEGRVVWSSYKIFISHNKPYSPNWDINTRGVYHIPQAYRKIMNLEIVNQRVWRVNLNLSDLICDWSDRFHLPYATVNISTVYWINDITRLPSVSHQKSVKRISLGRTDEVNAGAGIPPHNIPIEGKTSFRRTRAPPTPHNRYER